MLLRSEPKLFCSEKANPCKALFDAEYRGVAPPQRPAVDETKITPPPATIASLHSDVKMMGANVLTSNVLSSGSAAPSVAM